MHIQASMCTQLLVQFKFRLPSLRARSINLVSLIKAFKAQSYKNIVYVSAWGMSLAVGSIYLPCHLAFLLKSPGTATFGFLEIFNKGQANNAFQYQAFSSLALLRVSCRDNYPAPLPEFQWSLLLQHLSLSWQIRLFPWLRSINGPRGARRGQQLAARPWAETVWEGVSRRRSEGAHLGTVLYLWAASYAGLPVPDTPALPCFCLSCPPCTFSHEGGGLFHELLSLLNHLLMCSHLNMSNAWKSHHFNKIPSLMFIFSLATWFSFRLWLPWQHSQGG